MNKEKIKVAHIITMLELGGAQRNTLYTLQHLNRKIFQTILVCGPGGILDEEAKKLNDTKLYFVKWLTRKINPLYDAFAFLKLLQILHYEKPDIIHTHSSKAGILGRWATWFNNLISYYTKTIHTFHGFGFNNYQRWFVKKFFVSLEKLTAKITTKLIFVSEENIKTAIKNKIGKQKQYALIRSGIKISNYRDIGININQKKSEFGLVENSKIITTIGPFKPQKNLVDFVEMAKIVSQSLNHSIASSIKFLIVGDGKLRRSLELKVENLGVKDKVIFLGWRKDISEILSITDVFVLTSLWEGLPRAAVESLVSGKPVVAYAVDGIKEIIKNHETGFLVKPKDIKGLSEKVILLLNDEKTLKKMQSAAKNSIDETFDIDYMVREQEKLYLGI